MEKWRNGEMEKWRNGEMEKWIFEGEWSPWKQMTIQDCISLHISSAQSNQVCSILIPSGKVW